MTLYAEALATFDSLFAQAKAAGIPEPTAMTVATATPGGQPSARMALLKSYDSRGFVFYTHLDGRKGRELQAKLDPARRVLGVAVSLVAAEK